MYKKIFNIILKVVRKLYRFTFNPFYKYLHKPSGILELNDYRRTVSIDQNSQYNIYVTFDSRIDTDLDRSIAVINRNNLLVSGASWQWKSGQVLPPNQNNIFSGRQFYSSPKTFNATVFSLLTGGAGNYNYFHWMFDCLPRLHILKLSGLYDDVDLFLVPSLQYAFQRETLSYLKIDLQKTIESTTHSNIKAKTIIVSEHPVEVNQEPVPGWICDFLRTSFLPIAINPHLPSKKIYINRKDAVNSRRILNEDELIAELNKLGFISISAREYSLCEQIGIFANVEVIVGAHGAGLTNLVFCQAGTKVIEIFNYDFQPKMYEQLSYKMDLEYKRIVTGGVSHKDPLHSDIIVNVQEVIDSLSSLGIPTIQRI